MHQKVNPSLETAVNLGWTASKNETTFGVGCKYALDKDAFVRAKVNNSSQVGLGYQQKLREGNFSPKKRAKKIREMKTGHSISRIFGKSFRYLLIPMLN